jgi:Na+-driven multidrug efflux pump
VFCAFLWVWVKVGNMIVAGSVLNAGGETRLVLLMETTATWLIGVPTALVAAFVLDLPLYWVYLLLSVEEAVRLGVGVARLRSRRWARDLVGGLPAEG